MIKTKVFVTVVHFLCQYSSQGLIQSAQARGHKLLLYVKKQQTFMFLQQMRHYWPYRWKSSSLADKILLNAFLYIVKHYLKVSCTNLKTNKQCDRKFIILTLKWLSMIKRFLEIILFWLLNVNCMCLPLIHVFENCHFHLRLLWRKGNAFG